MANTRKRAAPDLPERIRTFLVPRLPPGAHMCAGLSGGLDSVVLLHLLHGLREALGFKLTAVHVHHGISPHADHWTELCVKYCQGLEVPLRVEKVVIRPTGEGMEAAARKQRYRVFARQGADFLILAHHRDDQAETLLFNLLRGSGVRGLAAMPEERPMADGKCRILRPMLSSTRREIADYASRHGLPCVEDESNLDVAQARNHLRHRVLPEIEERFPGYRAVLARTAGHMAESSALLDTLAEQDWNGVRSDNGLSLKGLRALSRPRAKNVMRWFLARHGAPMPRSARLEEMVDEIMRVAPDNRLNVRIGDQSLRIWKGRLQLTPDWPEGTEIVQPWDGEDRLSFAGGVVGLEPGLGQGLSRNRLAQAPVTLRTRRGGESIRPDCRRPRRELKKLFQELAIPPWHRGVLPMLYVGTTLAWVAGVGMECEFQAQEGEPGLVITWQPPTRWSA